MIYYFLLLTISSFITIFAMEHSTKGPSLLSGLRNCPNELQSKILLEAELPPVNFEWCGEELVRLKDGNLQVATVKKIDAFKTESDYYSAIKPFNQDVESIVQAFKKDAPSVEISGSINSSHVAFKTVNELRFSTVGTIPDQLEETISCEFPYWFDLRDWRLFLKCRSFTIFIQPFVIKKMGAQASFFVLDHAEKKLSKFHIVVDPRNSRSQQNQIYSMNKRDLKYWGERGLPELHYIAEPFAERRHLIPLILKLRNCDDKKHTFFTALYNWKNNSLHGWPIAEIPRNLKISIQKSSLNNRIPTGKELKQKDLPENTISRTDLYLLELDEKTTEWIKRALIFIESPKKHKVEDGIGLLKNYFDKNNPLNLVNKNKFRWATKNGNHGDLVSSIFESTELILFKKHSVASQAYLKNHIKWLVMGKKN